MFISSKREAILFIFGDIAVLYVSLWIMLTIRHLELPDVNSFLLHLAPFSILIVIWLIVFFIAGLYDRTSFLFRAGRRISEIVFGVQILNSAIAVLFFYLVPYFSIAPKTNLFIYLLVSFILLLGWRLFILRFVGTKRRQKALLIGSGAEVRELLKEINTNPRYNLVFVSTIDITNIAQLEPERDVLSVVRERDISVIVVDLDNEKVATVLPALYNLLFSKVYFGELHEVYEEVFARVPLSSVGYRWFLKNISSASHPVYDMLKRLTDIVAAIVLGVISLVFYPFVALAIKLDDSGVIFSCQERVGKDGDLIRLVKFRTMAFANDGGRWGKENQTGNRVTRVGSFLRRSRIDELPQLWNVLLGDISLIGPRPEFPEPTRAYSAEIPYYTIRYSIKPGLSGWAQINHKEHPHHGVEIEKTKEKLSYDLYYIKHRSFFLDLEIALKTIKTLLSRSGV